MTKRSYAVIAIIVVVAAIATTLSIAYSQGFGREPFVKITINDLKVRYKAKAPIIFSATIEGYGKPCGEIQAKILGTASTGSNVTIGPWAQVPSCVANQQSTSFVEKFPLVGDSITTSVNQTGTYKLMVTFKELPSNKESLAYQEFTVTSP